MKNKTFYPEKIGEYDEINSDEFPSNEDNYIEQEEMIRKEDEELKSLYTKTVFSFKEISQKYSGK